MSNIWKRLIAALLVLNLLTGICTAFADDEEVILEDVELENEMSDADYAEEMGEFLIDEETQTELDDLNEIMEVDETIDPNNLELNANLPDNVINILLIGIDSRSTTIETGLQHGDVQIILSINKDDGSVKLTSLMRDLYVNIPGYKNKNRLNLSYARGGGELSMRTVNHNFDMNIQHYVTINFYGLASIIDAIGGIDIELTKTEAGAINTYLRKHPPAYDNTDGKGRTPLKKAAGVQHLDGVQAVMYARLREIDNDFNRTARQRNLLELLLKKVMQDMSIDRLLTLMETCLPYVMTNVNVPTMFELAQAVLGSGIIARAQNGDNLLEQFRIPMDETWKYGKTDNGSSVVMFRTDKRKTENVQGLHGFIYGDYYPAN